jgi:hypothetical protein
MATKLQSGHEIFQNAIKYPVAMKYTKISYAGPIKIYQYWHFWYENILSGNPDSDTGCM